MSTAAKQTLAGIGSSGKKFNGNIFPAMVDAFVNYITSSGLWIFGRGMIQLTGVSKAGEGG
jgi:hypothetical protein